MTSARSVGLAAVIPLYLAVATALGFVDFRVRTHNERNVAYTRSVLANAEPAPGRYRILAPQAFDALASLTGLPRQTNDGQPGGAWFVFRWLCLVAALLAGHLYFRTWFDIGPAVAGNLIVAALLPLTFTNAWAHPDHFMELFLFTLGCACIVRRWDWAFATVLIFNGLNRETSVFLLPLYLLSRPFDRRHLLKTTALGVVWLMVFVGLRWRLGFVSYDPWQLGNNLKYLGLLPPNYDPYYRMFAWFVAFLALPLAALIAFSWRRQTRFTRTASAIVAPAFVIVAFLFSTVIETRIFTPLLPMMIPGALLALFPQTSSAS